MQTDEFIATLAQDLTPRWPLSRAFALAIVAGAVAIALFFFAAIGIRHNALQSMATLRYPIKFIETLALTIPAVGLVVRTGRPGAPLGAWAWALVVAPLLLAVAVVAELLVMPEATWTTRLIGSNAGYCLTLIPLMAAPALAFLLGALRYGAPTRPGLAGAVAGLAASGMAATFYASHCPDDSPLFVATWYPLATALVVLVGYGAGRRILKW